MKLVKTQADVARELRLTVRRVRELASEGMPGRPGRYDIDKIAAWRASRQPGGSDQAGATARLQRMQAQARVEELKAARLAGEVVTLERFEAVQRQLMTWFLAVMERVGQECGDFLGDDRRNWPEEMRLWFDAARAESVAAAGGDGK